MIKDLPWPDSDERIAHIGQNGGDGMHYDEEREKFAVKIDLSSAELVNKYDRKITGKYGTGSCVVDVYRVLSAFKTDSPEIDHAVKKLLAAGKRGAKDYKQDLLEAVQSIEAMLLRIEDESK
jgi:hypothetical protein